MKEMKKSLRLILDNERFYICFSDLYLLLKLVIWNQQQYFKDSAASLVSTGEKKLDI